MYQTTKIPRYRAIWNSIWLKTNPITSNADTFHGFTVCDEWREADGFKAWYDLNNVDDYELACDIYDKDNKHYSPSTALFVPPQLANLLRNRGAGFPIGVWKHGDDYHATYWFGQLHSLVDCADEPSAWKAYGLHKLTQFRGKIADELYDHIESQIKLGIR
ncbi:hypothetical protein KAT72_20870 [Aeromonas popoffii]|jgi:hypothetical protein|uniref:Uncharacterized protein n=1 Tax=Aeromonas popoffii TaxID=70856 RepID=A0ABS5GW62_9GAMM|nr:hypothetical protein [Aeromonas popoffii]MBR7631387.1 hypothetical protein [Aeromonas popoffii]